MSPMLMYICLGFALAMPVFDTHLESAFGHADGAAVDHRVEGRQPRHRTNVSNPFLQQRSCVHLHAIPAVKLEQLKDASHNAVYRMVDSQHAQATHRMSMSHRALMACAQGTTVRSRAACCRLPTVWRTKQVLGGTKPFRD
jgi:hypothetical protein